MSNYVLIPISGENGTVSIIQVSRLAATYLMLQDACARIVISFMLSQKSSALLCNTNYLHQTVIPPHCCCVRRCMQNGIIPLQEGPK
jgi:hypothetical protein